MELCEYARKLAGEAYVQVVAVHHAAGGNGQPMNAQLDGKDGVWLDKQLEAEEGFSPALYRLSSSVRIRLEVMRSCSDESRS